MNNNLLPHVTQEPIIAYDMLSAIGEKVKTEIANLNIEAIEATEENLSSIKKLRAELNKNFSDLEERRKFIKGVVLKPYDDFDVNYKNLIAVEFQNADALLKDKASIVESEILTKKTDNLKAYFVKKNRFDFIKFEDFGLKITKSSSDKSIQTEIDRKLKQVEGDLAVIETLEHKDRVLAKYHISKDLNHAISNVNIEIQKEKEIAEAKSKQVALVTEKTTDAPVEKPEEPVIEGHVKGTPEADTKIYKMNFSVFGTKSQLKSIKEFMEEKGIKYE